MVRNSRQGYLYEMMITGQMKVTMDPMAVVPKIDDAFSEDSHIVAHVGNTLLFVKTLPSDVFRLIITSPPYNLGKEYEEAKSIDDYLKEQEVVIEELIRCLAKDGSICWQVGNFVNDGEVYPLDTLFYPIFKRHGLKLRNRIIWHFGHGLHASRRFSGRYETLLWFTKSDEYVFNLDDVRVPAKYPGKTYYKGPNRGKPSGNPLGANPSDVWTFLAQEWESEFLGNSECQSQPPGKNHSPLSISCGIGGAMRPSFYAGRRLGSRSIYGSRVSAGRWPRTQ